MGAAMTGSDSPMTLDDLVAGVIEFAPAFKETRHGRFWYAEGWVGGQRIEFATQESEHAARELCHRLNTVVAATHNQAASQLLAMREELDALKFDFDRTRARETQFLNENLAMKEALEPFAAFADLSGAGYLPDDHVITLGSGMAARQLTMGDCRKARSVLSPNRSGGGYA